MQVFSSIKCDLPQTDNAGFYTFSEQVYTVFGTVSPTVKTLILDGELIPINPITFTWSVIKKAPKTEAITPVTHTIQYFGRGTDPHDLGSGSNYVKVTVRPAC